MMMFYILSLLLVCIGGVLVYRPQTWLELVQFWTERAMPKPSRMKKLVIRICGAVCALGGILYIALTLMMG